MFDGKNNKPTAKVFANHQTIYGSTKLEGEVIKKLIRKFYNSKNIMVIFRIWR